ncbi:MAG: phosphate ABC transporter permease PstA [Bdellovibrionales bacterium]|nr:phosphate ABC transporter permease PstA [Bdellovibrionales bacterium]
MNFKNWTYLQRRIINWMAKIVLFLFTFLALLPLIMILFYVLRQGGNVLSWSFLTTLPGPTGSTGGMANSIVGSLVMVALASIVGIPLGIVSGVYLSEYGVGKTANILRFSLDLLTCVPSIIVGIFVYGIVVIRYGFSAYAGAFSLALIMLPIVARSSEEIFKLMPGHIREAGLALGLSRWRVILQILLPGCRKAVLTAIMLAVARIFGETAPLLFTALGNQFYARSLSQPTASMSVQIFNWARSGFADLEQQAWAGSFVLVTLILFMNLATRFLGRVRS